jgi:phage minor structural protein
LAYRIDLFDSSGARVAIIQEEIISSLSLDTAIDSAPTLTLSIPLSEEKTAYISPAYHLKIWNTTTAAYEHSVFTLCDPDIEDSGGALKITATYQGILTRLSNEDIDAYDTGSAGDTFENVITALLAFQLNTPAITLGTIEPVQTVALAVENTTIYSALNAVRDAFGGWFEVDADYQLNWYNDNTNTPDREIRRSKNLKSLTYTPSYTQIVNRVYAYGKGESDARITLLDAGEAHEYIEDATSQAIYGIMAKRYVDKSITHPTTLLKYAQRILAQYKTPPYQYSVDVVNLAEVRDYDYSLESLGLDTRVRVIDDILSVDVNTSIVSMSIDLLSPADITIELSTVKTDLSDIFKDIISTQNINQSVATQISAGQVTVLGTFVVADWASAGVTTIDGGNITTNTIAANALTTSTMTARTITLSGANSILQGNYTAGSAGWQIKGDGNAEFNNVTIRGNLASCTIGSNKVLTAIGDIMSENYSSTDGWILLGFGTAIFRQGLITTSINATNVICSGYVYTSSKIYFGDTHYLERYGNHIYWYDGTNSIRLD